MCDLKDNHFCCHTEGSGKKKEKLRAEGVGEWSSGWRHRYKKKRIKSKMCLYRKQIINRTSHHAKKKKGRKKPHRNLVSSLSRQTGTTPGQRLQPHKLSHRHWSAWVCLNTHRNIYQLGSSTASDSLYVHTVSLISPSITHLQLMLFNS